jgi:hypothetical protein
MSTDRKKNKKKFKETGVGKFLLEKIPNAIGSLGDVLPDKGVLGVVKNIIASNRELTEAEREMAYKLLAMDMAEMEAVTARWEADMTSDSWLSKNVRPLTLIYLTIVCSLLIIADSIGWAFEVDIVWIDLLKTLLVSVYLAYFGSRGYEKYQKIKAEGKSVNKDEAEN